jgi:multidrug efflux pump subunit AcrB
MEQLQTTPMPPGTSIEVAGAAEKSSEANSALFRALPFGLGLLVAVLLLEFNSFRRVAIILVTVPLAITGIVPGLLVGREPFGFMSLLGVFALSGIVVNNAIVLVDRIDCMRTEGRQLEEAIAAAVNQRTRPIILTSATTILGLLPLALSDSNLWPPLAWAMISGLIGSTGLTLLVAPALYLLFFRAWRGGEMSAGCS